MTTKSSMRQQPSGLPFVLALVPPDELRDATNFLRACSIGGLLGRVAVASITDVRELRGQADAYGGNDGFDATDTVQSVLNSVQISELAVLSVRTSAMRSADFGAEDRALEIIRDIVPDALSQHVRAVTVAPHLPHTTTEDASYSAQWDCHLICSSRAAPSPSLQQSRLADSLPSEANAQALLAGLCAVGGWDGPSAGHVESDFQDGGLMPVRFCHASMRVVYAPHMDRSDRSRFIPHSSPWPLPQGAGCESASLSSVPPWEMVNQAADLLRFRCNKPDASGTVHSKRFRLWRKLHLPTRQSSEERALRVFLSRIGFDDRADATSAEVTPQEVRQLSRQHCRDTMHDLGIETVAEHLERSGFELPDGAAEASKPTPSTWNDLHQLCLALLDGGTLPEGIARPLGPSGNRLVWTEAHSVIPAPDDGAEGNPERDSVGPDENAVDTETPEIGATEGEDAQASEADAPPLGGDGHEGHSQMQERPRVIEALDAVRRRHSQMQERAQTQEPPPSTDGDADPKDEVAPSVTKTEDAPSSTDALDTAWKAPDWMPELQEDHSDELLEGKVPMGGAHDSFIRRLGQVLDNALQEATDGFCQHAFLYSNERERYADARQAQHKARRVGSVMAALAFVSALFAVDQRWPFVNEAWRESFGSNAPLRLYDPSLVATVPLLICLGVLIFGGLYLFRSWRVFARSAAKLEQANQNRRQNSISLLHYVTELLRVRTLVRQFADHTTVIARLVHRPFGVVVLADASAVPEPSWFDGVTLPLGMLVGSASPSGEISEADQRRLRYVFRANWLNEMLHMARKGWGAAYRDRIVSGFEWPEADTSPQGTVKHRDRQTGDPVLGARGDWLRYVAANEEGLTVTARRWLDNRMDEAAIGDDASYASYLTQVTSYSEHIGWWEHALDLLDGTVEQHSFDWDKLLSPTAPTPSSATPIAESLQTVACCNDQFMALFRWEFLVTKAVPPQNLRSWATPASPIRTDPDTEALV